MKMPAFLRIAASGLLAALVSAPTTATAQSRVFAPYIDISLSNNNLAQISQSSGIKVFTLAFIVGNGCENSWFGIIPVSSDTTYKPLIDALRSAGGDIIISFGGASGVELAGTCTNVSNIQAQYQAVINKYGVKMLDFDIEGAAVADTAAIDRRNQALAALQKANSGLVISYTLPIEPTGLDNFCLNLLTNAKSHGVNVAVVNVMTMDFGGTVNPNAMGQASIDSANATISQLQSIGLSAKVGITPMIGRNDTSPEIFTVADAQKVLSYAQSNSSITRLAFWSVARDQSCPGGSPEVTDTCSGISQKPWDFSHVFEAFGGSGGGTKQVATPSFSPAGGTYTSAQSVSIGTSTGGASIRYTTDSSTPTETHGTVYSSLVSIGTTTSLEAIGYESGFTDSNIASATYTIGSGGGGGSTLNFEAASLSPVGTGATVSASADPNVTGGLLEFLNATAVGQSMALTTPSIPAGTYQVQFRYKTNTSRGQSTVAIDGAQVGGTIDQYATTPAYPTATLGSVTFATTGAHTIVLTVTGKAAASTKFYITADKFTLTSQGGEQQVAAPAFGPAGGSYTSAQMVTISDTASDAIIRYTTDGSTPSDTNGTVYSGTAVNISSTTVLQAIASESGFTDSTVTSATYTISTGGGSTFNFEAANMSPVGTGATVSTSSDSNVTGGLLEFLNATAVGQSMTLTTPSMPAGTYQVQFRYKTNTSRAQHNVAIDGAQVGGTIDQYATTSTYPTATLGNVTFASAGMHTIVLKLTGKDAAATHFYITADKFTFVGE